MEVETRPPLVDGQLGLHALRGSPDLGLSITENDIILSDDERELVQSPVEERISYVKDSFVSGSERGDERDDVPGESSSSPKCNGDVPTEPVSDAASVFRTESSSEEVRGAELDGGTSKDCSEGDKDTTSAELSLTEEESCPESFSLSVGPCDVTSSEGVVEDSLHNSESHVSGNQTPVDGNSQDDQLKTVSRTTESSGDVKHPNRNGEKDVEDLSGLPPKSFKDFDDLDEIEIPEVIDISSISFNKGNHDESIPVEDAEFSNQVEDETAASSDVAVNEKEDDDATAEAYGDKAGDVDPMVDECMGFDQEEDESPGYHGMTDDILPIIESELDDIPVGEGNIFDTEVECGDSTSMEEPENQDETIADLSADIDIADNEPSHLVSENSRTADDGSEESLVKKDLRETFSSSAHPKLKRRASADEVTSPPCKLLKRQTSLDHLYECAEKPVRAASIEEFRKLASKNSSPAPKSIASEPVDTPVEIEKNEVAAKPAERKDAVADSLETPTESAVKEPSGDGKESVLVIDLDDDDKMNTDPSAESHSDGKVESSKSAHRSALDVLFNGKKEITLNRKMFTRVMKSCVSQYLLTFSDLGKATSFSLKANTVLSRIQSNVSSFEKQKDDFKSIMTKLIKDRQAKKTWDETLVPPKVTRSVGLQVCSVGSMYVKNAPNSEGTSTKISRSKFSSSHQNQALIQQKKAYAQQQLALSQSKVKQVELQMASMRPIAKKSVTPTNRPVAIKTIPATKPMVPPKPKPVPQFPVTSPKMNGLKAVSMTRNPEPAGTQNNTPLTITTASPNARTFTLSNRGTYAVKSPQKTLIQVSPVSKPASTLLSKALTASDVAGRGNLINVGAKPGPQSVSKAVPVALTRTPGPVHNSKNLTSGPGRPGKSPVPVSSPDYLSSPSAITSSVIRVLNIPAQLDKLKKPLSSLETTIDLTDLDDDAPQPAKPVTSNTTARKSTSSASRAALQSKVPNIAPNKQMRHPPLPPNPPNFSSQFAPPRPYLGICDTQTVTQGIMLTWHFNNVTPPRKISKFQVFAYQETKGDGEDAWKKVGDVDALPLPMACTLTQFREGYTYHFIVRAVDEAANVGPFSAPNTITLMKKTV